VGNGRKVTWRPDEPARQPQYRKSQDMIHDRLANQDGCITWLLIEVRSLQKRVEKLETWRARTVTEPLDEPVPQLDQHSNL
jgi:hypothetical protein